MTGRLVTESVPSFDALKRGHTILAPDPFKSAGDATRPWVVINNESHPFDEQQYVVMGLTTQTWYDERIPLKDAIIVIGLPRAGVRLFHTPWRLSNQY